MQERMIRECHLEWARGKGACSTAMNYLADKVGTSADNLCHEYSRWALNRDFPWPEIFLCHHNNIIREKAQKLIESRQGKSTPAPDPAPAPTGAWLRRWSHQDIYAAIRAAGVLPAVRRELQRMKRQRRPRRQDTLLWRGELTHLPRNRSFCLSEDMTVGNITVPAGSRIVVRLRRADGPYQAEVVRTQAGQLRVHVWQRQSQGSGW